MAPIRPTLPGRRVLASAVVALAAWGVGAPAAHAAPPGSPPSLRWTPCRGGAAPGTQAGLDCTTVRVPLDYDQPRGRQIGIRLIRHRATDPAHRRGTLFWSPGGPGGAATTTAAFFVPLFPREVRARFDVVSFDPRGIGQSSPLECFDSPEQEQQLLAGLPAGFPVGPAENARAAAVQARFDRACAQHGGAIQRHMSTANVARDLDRLRAAVGDRKLNYYGPSYGSYLGSTYANLRPGRMGRMVLDGNVPPEAWTDARAGRTRNTFGRIGSPAGAQRGLDMMLDACGRVGAERCAFSAGSATATRAKYAGLLSRLKAGPLTLGEQPLTYAASVSLVGSLLEFQNANALLPGWKGLGDFLQAEWTAAQSPSATAPAPASVRPLLASAAAPASGQEATDGVLCSESPNPADPLGYGLQGTRLDASQSPSGFGDLWTWLAQPCAGWTARDADRYTGPYDRPTAPILAIGTLGDSNTAYASSVKLVHQLHDARLLTETGGGHTALGNPSRCADRAITRYLLRGTLPRRGTVCHQDERPF